jgi:hypothetical protein
MKTLIEAVEEWIDLRIFASSKNAIFETKFNEMEKIHIRDAERIATLERRVMELSDPVDEALYLSFDELVERVDTLESEIYEVQKTTEDIPDSYSIEVMIGDALETKVMDAVKEELDATEFKVTIER